MSDARERNRAAFEGAFGAVYSFYMERPWMRRILGLTVWGGSAEPNEALIDEVARVPAGGVIVDAPCGTAPALERLRRDGAVRYVALDLAHAMLARARARAERLGVAGVEFVQGDAEAVPVADGEADLFLSLFGLHCLPDPAAAVREIARCLKPGGRAAVSTICTGPGLRQRLVVRPNTGGFGPVGSAEDLDRWLADARLDVERRAQSGPFAYVTAVRAA